MFFRGQIIGNKILTTIGGGGFGAATSRKTPDRQESRARVQHRQTLDLASCCATVSYCAQPPEYRAILTAESRRTSSSS
jgi:hypothetical protein